MRRLIALCLLLVTTAFNAEAVAGALRDGQVHHEDLATASSHAASPDGEHGHEDGSPLPGHRHDQNHEHGTSADHCTHHHGAALVPSFSFCISLSESGISRAEPLLPHLLDATTLVRPPRA